MTKKNGTRISALLLLLALAAGTASCGGEAAVPADGTENPEGSRQTEAETEALPERQPYIQKNDWGGAPFCILAPVWGLYEHYFFSDGADGEVMNDAIWQRETQAEEYLNVDISYRLEGTINDEMDRIRRAVSAGEDIYQLVLTHNITNSGAMITENLLLDWNDISSVDLSRSYWNQDCNRNLSLPGGRQYYAVSDYMLADTNGVLFNKTMLSSYDLENPYDLVRAGKWTIDKMTEMGTAVRMDLNGDGKFDENDQYGVTCGQNFIVNSIYNAAGIYLVEKDANDNMVLSFYNERTAAVVEKMDYLFHKSGGAYTWTNEQESTKSVNMRSGRALFYLEALYNLRDYRDCTVDYGILPYPKFDEAQEGYYSNDWSGLMAVPVIAEQTDMIGEVCEMLAFYSADTTMPAYYNLILGEKLSRDADSKEMLSIIYNNVVYDPGLYFFGWGNVIDLYYTIVRQVLAKDADSISAYYEKVQKAANKEIEKFLTECAALE